MTAPHDGPQPMTPQPGPGPWHEPPPVDPAAIDWRRVPPPARPTLPVERRDYFAFWRAPSYRWWKGLLALVLALILFLVESTVLGMIGILLDGSLEQMLPQPGEDPTKIELVVGPWVFLFNNLSLALGIPIAMGMQWALVGQRPGWLSSVVGRVRWGWLGLCLAVCLPVWIVLVVVEGLVMGFPELSLQPHTAFMIAAILLTTPFQAAGEEYLVRGLVGRSVASWFPVPLAGFLVSTAVSAAIFMAMHGAGDVWLNVFYLLFGAVGSWLAWRTGGLEAAVAIHVVNNVVAMYSLPFSDFSGLFDRSAGAGHPVMLVHMAVVVGVGAVLAHLARRRGLVAASAPGREALRRPPFAPTQPVPHPTVDRPLG